MQLRPYTAGDFEAVYALDVACFAPRFRFSRAMMLQVVGGRGAVTVVACEADGTVVGFCAASLERRRGVAVGYVSTLDVAPASRRRGLGRELMCAVERAMAGRGAESIVLHVFTGNEEAIRLYEALGYARAGSAPDFYGAGYAAWVYAKRLGPASGTLGELAVRAS